MDTDLKERDQFLIQMKHQIKARYGPLVGPEDRERPCAFADAILSDQSQGVPTFAWHLHWSPRDWINGLVLVRN